MLFPDLDGRSQAQDVVPEGAESVVPEEARFCGDFDDSRDGPLGEQFESRTPEQRVIVCFHHVEVAQVGVPVGDVPDVYGNEAREEERPFARRECVGVFFFVHEPLVPGAEPDAPCTRGGARFGEDPEVYRCRRDGVGVLEVGLQVAHAETAEVGPVYFAFVVDGQARAEFDVVCDADSECESAARRGRVVVEGVGGVGSEHLVAVHCERMPVTYRLVATRNQEETLLERTRRGYVYALRVSAGTYLGRED